MLLSVCAGSALTSSRLPRPTLRATRTRSWLPTSCLTSRTMTRVIMLLSRGSEHDPLRSHCLYFCHSLRDKRRWAGFDVLMSRVFWLAQGIAGSWKRDGRA